MRHHSCQALAGAEPLRSGQLVRSSPVPCCCPSSNSRTCRCTPSHPMPPLTSLAIPPVTRHPSHHIHPSAAAAAAAAVLVD